MTVSVQGHYGSSGIVARILEAIPWSRDDGTVLTAPQIFPYDQLHGRELLATQDHAAQLNPKPGDHLLDIGSGIGGPARYFADKFGCRVTGIDLTPDFVAAAKDLSKLCNLDHLLTFVEADAAVIPFDADTFDHAYSFYVGMNLADKPAVMRECFRVLKPDGTLLWTEVTETTPGAIFPLPWARNLSSSHVQYKDVLINTLTDAGFEIMDIEDETSAHLELARRIKISGKVLSVEHEQANEIVLGADFALRRKNYIQSLAEGYIESTLIVARKPA